MYYLLNYTLYFNKITMCLRTYFYKRVYQSSRNMLWSNSTLLMMTLIIYTIERI